MAHTCETIAEAVVFIGKNIPPGYATYALSETNMVMCYFAPQTCAALPLTLAAGNVIDRWAQLVQSSDGMEKLNIAAISSGCRFVIAPVERSKDLWRFILVSVDDVNKTANEISEATKHELRKAHRSTNKIVKIFSTSEGIEWLMSFLR